MAGIGLKIGLTYTLLMMPALVLSSMNVKCAGSIDGDQSDLKISLSGTQVDIITNVERNTFGIDDRNAKLAAALEFGRKPDNIYARGPTPPYDDLYDKYGWGQVTRSLVPKFGRILSMSSKPTIVTEQILENNSSHTGTFKAEITQTVENTVSSSWNKGGELNVGQEIEYSFEFAFGSIGGTTSFSYGSNWGESTEKSQSVTLGSTAGLEVELAPQQSVQVQLLATRGTVKLEVEYDSSISGGMAMRFDKKYRGYHFWWMAVSKLLEKAKLPNSKTSREVIEIGFYSQSQVIMRDRATGNVTYF